MSENRRGIFLTHTVESYHQTCMHVKRLTR